MSKNTRKRYPPEFKHGAVRLVTDKGYKIAEAARSLDINSNMLGRWVRETRQTANSVMVGKGEHNPEQDEIHLSYLGYVSPVEYEKLTKIV